MLMQMFLMWMFAVGGSPRMIGTHASAGQRFSVIQTIPLRGDDSNMQLQLLVDNRLSPSIRREMWGAGDWSIVLPSQSSEYKSFSGAPPENARLQLTREMDGVLFERKLDTPLAELREMPALTGSQRTFFLTMDYSAGYGSYSGLATSLLQVSGTKMLDLDADNESTRTRESIRLMQSRKSNWIVVTSSGQPEILALSCKLGQDGSFVLTYTRYYYSSKGWIARQRQEPGFWESDEAFPPPSQFP